MKLRYSQFDTQEIAACVAEEYALPAPLECKFLKNGLNDMYKLTAADGNAYFLRISLARVHTLAEIEDELAVILRCRDAGLDVVEPIARRDGRYVWEVDAPEACGRSC